MKSNEWQKFKRGCPSKSSEYNDYRICGAKAFDEFPSDKQLCKYQRECPLLYLLKFSGKG